LRTITVVVKDFDEVVGVISKMMDERKDFKIEIRMEKNGHLRIFPED
jgi:hypothetical protein